MSITELNVQGFRIINDLSKDFSFLNLPFVFIAEYLLILIIVIALILFFTPLKQCRLMIICALLTVILAVIIRIPVSMLHSNLQPFAELENVNQLIEKTVGNSFPSDHAILIFSICVTFALFQKRFAWLWLTLASLVGVLRIWAGVHYPADVLTGALIAVIAAIIVFFIVPKLPFAKRLAKQQIEITD